MATRKPRKAREYTGPHTLDGVKVFCQSDPLPTMKAMEQAAKTLTPEEFRELAKWTVERLKRAMEIHRKVMDAEWKERGMEFSND